MMEKIKLIVKLDACLFSNEIEDECVDRDISTHYQNDLFYLDWTDDEMPLMKKWLISEYGEEIKKYTSFAVQAT